MRAPRLVLLLAAHASPVRCLAGPSGCYVLSAALGVTALAFSLGACETLPRSNRVPFSMSVATNPLGFVRLFRSGRLVFLLSSILALQVRQRPALRSRSAASRISHRSHRSYRTHHACHSCRSYRSYHAYHTQNADLSLGVRASLALFPCRLLAALARWPRPDPPRPAPRARGFGNVPRVP